MYYIIINNIIILSCWLLVIFKYFSNVFKKSFIRSKGYNPHLVPFLLSKTSCHIPFYHGLAIWCCLFIIIKFSSQLFRNCEPLQSRQFEQMNRSQHMYKKWFECIVLFSYQVLTQKEGLPEVSRGPAQLIRLRCLTSPSIDTTSSTRPGPRQTRCQFLTILLLRQPFQKS